MDFERLFPADITTITSRDYAGVFSCFYVLSYIYAQTRSFSLIVVCVFAESCRANSRFALITARSLLICEALYRPLSLSLALCLSVCLSATRWHRRTMNFIVVHRMMLFLFLHLSLTVTCAAGLEWH